MEIWRPSVEHVTLGHVQPRVVIFPCRTHYRPSCVNCVIGFMAHHGLCFNGSSFSIDMNFDGTSTHLSSLKMNADIWWLLTSPFYDFFAPCGLGGIVEYRVSPPRFLAECFKRQLNQGSFVLLYFRLFNFFDLYWVCLSVFSCTVLFVSISQVIGCEDRLRNDLYCVKWGVKLYSNQPAIMIFTVWRYASAVCAMALCLSVSVTSQCSTKTAKRRIT